MSFTPPAQKTFIAMAGIIGCGKTTAAKLMSATFGLELFDEPVIDNRFLAHYYKDMKRWSFTLQLEFLIKRVQHHEIISQVQKSCIQDRTLYEDPEIFAKYLHGLGHMDSKELDLYFEYFHRLEADLHRPEKVICLQLPDARIALERIKARGRPEEASMTLDFLEGLNAFYTVFPQICAHKYGIDVLTLDVSQLDIRSGAGKEAFLDKVNNFIQ